MKRTTVLTILLSINCLLLSAFPSWAGEWRKNALDKWQYIQDDGVMATGWLQINGEYYYFDSDGNRKEDYWLKDDGSWYYFSENGSMATNMWVDNYYVGEEGRMEKKR